MSEQWKAEKTPGTAVDADLLSIVWPRVSMVMENRTCKEIIESLITQYGLSVDIAIDHSDPPKEQITGECEECGGTCRWEYADWYGEESQ